MDKKPLNTRGKSSKLSNTKWLKIGLVGFLVVVGLLILGMITSKVATSSAVCASCHEMSPEVHTWEASAHSSVECVDCHYEPGFSGKLEAQGDFFVRAFKKVTNTAEDPIEIHGTIPDSACESCHTMENRTVSPNGDTIPEHDQHKEKNVDCVECHSGVAHGNVDERKLSDSDSYDDWSEASGVQAMKSPSGTGSLVSMEDCTSCHESRDVSNECATCHSTGMKLESHNDPSFATSLHGAGAKEDIASCNTCHKYMSETEITVVGNESSSASSYLNDGEKQTIPPKEYIRQNDFCRDCHSQRPPSHDEAFFGKHGMMAETEKEKCLTCHDETPGPTPQISTVNCSTCHEDSHEYQWQTQHPRTSSPPTKLANDCYSCHAESQCKTCHLAS